MIYMTCMFTCFTPTFLLAKHRIVQPGNEVKIPKHPDTKLLTRGGMMFVGLALMSKCNVMGAPR